MLCFLQRIPVGNSTQSTIPVCGPKRPSRALKATQASPLSLGLNSNQFRTLNFVNRSNGSKISYIFFVRIAVADLK